MCVHPTQLCMHLMGWMTIGRVSRGGGHGSAQQQAQQQQATATHLPGRRRSCRGPPPSELLSSAEGQEGVQAVVGGQEVSHRCRQGHDDGSKGRQSCSCCTWRPNSAAAPPATAAWPHSSPPTNTQHLIPKSAAYAAPPQEGARLASSRTRPPTFFRPPAILHEAGQLTPCFEPAPPPAAHGRRLEAVATGG